MGSISRALARAGYLRPVVDSLNELIQRRKYEQGLQQLAEMLSRSENRMRDIYESKAYNKMEPSRTESNIDVDAEENLQPLGLDKVKKSSPLAYLSSVKPPERTPLPITDDKPVAPRIDIGQPEYEVLGDIKEGPKYTQQEQNRLAGQEINSFLRRLITSQDIPMERGQVGLSALQQLANTYKPEKRELMSVGKGADIIDTRTGERVYENLDEGKKNEYGWVTIGSGNKGGKKMVTQENKITGERRTVEVGEEDKPGGTTVNVGTKSYGDKLGEIVQTKQEIDNIKKAKWVTKDEVLRAGYTWGGGNLGGAYIYGDKLFYTDQELNNYKEQVKTKAVGATVALLNEQGLDNAKQKIDADVSKGASYKEAYDAFVKNNPGADKEDLRILYDYIDLMGK